MAASERRHAELDRYLLDGERLVTAVHQHWGKVAEPVASAAAGLVVALWADVKLPPSVGVVSTVLWWAWFALVLRMAYLVAEWRHDWFVATDKRLLLFYGFITRKVSMMPLAKVTDMSYERSVPGRILGYGRFVMESAGQDQALRVVNWVPDPDHHYRAICAEIFGVSDHEGDDLDDRWRDAASPLPNLPDPYPGWDDPSHGATSPDSLYRSPDLHRRDRSADTGPIPIHPPRKRRPDGSDD
ncbi:PH domain-containing protein [Pedococcus sp. KACC 23699]|uniref:PH domain-containing protein n=1 Tax=Pedococcus sp. KACC 23699 TaxID=3149228 RepID=A0AAU7K0D1_9MICO